MICDGRSKAANALVLVRSRIHEGVLGLDDYLRLEGGLGGGWGVLGQLGEIQGVLAGLLQLGQAGLTLARNYLLGSG